MRADLVPAETANHRKGFAITVYSGAAGGNSLGCMGRQRKRQRWQTAGCKRGELHTHTLASELVAEITASINATAMAQSSQAAPARATSGLVL